MVSSKDMFMELRQQENEMPAFYKDLDKATIKQQAQMVKQTIDDGNLSAVDVLIVSKKMQELGKEIENISRPIAEGNPGFGTSEKYNRFSCELSQKINGAKTDYTACGDELLNALYSELEALKLKIKDREGFLSGVTKQMTIVDEETGDIQTINPPIKTGKLGIAVSIK